MATLTKLIRGETFLFSEPVSGASSVEVRLRGPKSINLAAQQTAGEWVANAATEQWPAGGYVVEIWVTRDGVKSVILRSLLNVRESGLDSSIASQAVANLEAMLAGTASELVREYQINNRRLANYSVDELLRLLSFWKNRLNTERRREAGISTLGPRIAVRI